MQVQFWSLKQPLDDIKGIIGREIDMKNQLLPKKPGFSIVFPENLSPSFFDIFGCQKTRPWSVKTFSLQLSNKQRDTTIAFKENGRHI